MLIATLLISTILLILGLAYLGRRANQVKFALAEQESTRALELALAGLETVRVKLDKDPQFPPLEPLGRKIYSYSEFIYDLDEVSLIGRYEVTLDGQYLVPPYRILRVKVVGELADEVARRVILAEFDMSPTLRHDAATENPRYFDMVNFQDMGSL